MATFLIIHKGESFNRAKGPARFEGPSAVDLINYQQHLVKLEGLRPASANRRLEALMRFCRYSQQTKRLRTSVAIDLGPVRMVRNIGRGLIELEVHARR